MAIRAASGKTQHRLAVGDHLIGPAGVFQFLWKCVERVLPFAQRPHCHGVLHGIGLCRPQFIAGHLFHQEPVERFALIETPDYIIAVTPRLFVIDVGFIAARVCIANHIQPITSQAFTKRSGRQQSVDHA